MGEDHKPQVAKTAPFVMDMEPEHISGALVDDQRISPSVMALMAVPDFLQLPLK